MLTRLHHEPASEINDLDPGSLPRSHLCAPNCAPARSAPGHQPRARARLRPLERRAHIVVGDDPVALEDADRLMPSHAHCHALIDAGRHEITDGGAPEIVKDQRGPHDRLASPVEHRASVTPQLRLGKPGGDAGGRPRLTEVANARAVPMEDVPRLRADATPPAWNGYLLTVACPCGVVFERWITPWDAELDLLRAVGLN